MIRIIKKALLICVCLCVISCGEPQLEIIDKYISPDEKYIAIVTAIQGNATVGHGIKLFINRFDGQEELDLRHPLLVLDKYSGLEFTWENDQVFKVTYNKANIYDYCNIWYDPIVSPPYSLEILLEKN